MKKFLEKEAEDLTEQELERRFNYLAKQSHKLRCQTLRNMGEKNP